MGGQTPTLASRKSRVRVNSRCAPVAQLDRAADFESVGREFESPQARQKHLTLCVVLPDAGSSVRRQACVAGKGRDTPTLRPREGSVQVTTNNRTKQPGVLSVFGELLGHRHQEPAVCARHALKALDQPLDGLSQVHLVRDLGRGRLSLTLEEQLVRLDFQRFGELFQSRDRGCCISTLYARDV